MSRVNIHATGLVLGKTGLILRGAPGAGKSLLALGLMDEWEWRGLTAKLVSDDRIEIEATSHGLAMYAAPNIEGLIELRGRGIVERPFVRRAALHLVIDLVDSFDRMVEEDQLVTTLEGVRIARCPVPRAGRVDNGHQLLLIREAIRSLKGATPSRKKTA